MSEDRIRELETENARLRKKIAELRRRLDAYTKRATKQYLYEQDYIPYQEDERE